MKPLQSFDFDKSAYERPDARWICGRARCGDACSEGPDPRGGCSVRQPACSPQREEGSWRCARSPACRSGPSVQGLCPERAPRCVPEAGLRVRRGIWTRLAVVLSVAVLVALLAAEPTRSRLLDPGGHSAGHAAIADDCGACHAAVDDGLAGWLRSSLSGAGEGAVSARCLGCHQVGHAPLYAHGLPPGVLGATAEATEREPWTWSLARAVAGQPGAEALACATCHREHRGAVDLTAIASDRCQACHTERFVGFDQGHPPFSDFGKMHVTRIAFSHADHLVGGNAPSYFAREGEPVDLAASCAQCHVASPDGRDYVLRGFEVSCARCHDEGLRTALGEPRLLAFPSFSVEGLDEVGSWPLEAKAVAEPERGDTPFMRALLARDGLPEDILALAARVHTVCCLTDPEHFSRVEADPRRVERLTRRACKTCDGEVGVRPLDGATKAELEAYVRAVKQLVRELRAAGDGSLEGLSARLAALDGPGSTRGASAAAPLAEALPDSALVVALRRWLPDLDERPGDGVPLVLTEEEAAAVDELDGALVSDLAVRWRPGHADPLLTAWLDLVSTLALAPDDPLYASLTAGPAGACLRCHTPQPLAGPLGDARWPREIPWRGAGADRHIKSFSAFSHAPHSRFPEHLDAAGRTACLACHSLDGGPDSEGRSQVGLRSFARHETCVGCHTTAAALPVAGEPIPHRGPTDCLACHNYHVGHVRSTWEGRDD